MSVDPDKPTVLDALRGQGGEGWRMFVAVGSCAVLVMLVTGLVALIRIWSG